MNVSAIFNASEQALAAYANLTPGPTSDLGRRDALFAGGMSQKQAEEFAARYPTVVAVYSDPVSDLQLTVFKDVAGNLSLAIRGTTLGHDLVVTDAYIGGLGMAYDQIVALWNWWQRASTVSGQQVNQFKLVGDRLEAGAPVAATGDLVQALAADPDRKIDVTGHSLGGYLAMAFNTMFRDAVGQVTEFKAPASPELFAANDSAWVERA